MAGTSVEVDVSLIEEITENLDVDGVYLKAGVLDRATAVEFTPNGIKAIKPAEYAYKHEFGIDVPQRSFLRTTLSENEKEWVDMFSTFLVRNNFDVVLTLEQMRTSVSGAIMQKITDGNFKPLSPKTIEYKREQNFPKPEAPLIASSTMLSSIDSEVVGK